MRIHTDADLATVRAAIRAAGATADTLTVHRSTKRAHGYTVLLSGGSSRRQNGGPNYAATWDQWGVFLAAIYAADAESVCPYYADFETFGYCTDWRFDNGWPADYHGDHSWVVGTPFQQPCRKCTAIRRWR